jgi:amidase
MRVEAATELWRLSAGELADAIRSGQVSSRDIVEAHLRRIEAVNPSINAIPVVLAENALDAARAADRAVVAGETLGRFHGVPFTVKSNIDVAGTPTTHGMAAMASAYPTRDAPIVERLRSAGGIPIGRTNMPDFAISWHTDSELYGATVNPWDPSRTPGASSGGEAAALATGMSPLGLGNDMLGSLRWPAQCCGIAALKPTLGRIPHATTVEPVDMPIGAQLAGVNGPLARRIADLRAAFDVLAGPTWRDPWTVPVPLRGPEPAHPVRVAVVLRPEGPCSVQVKDGVRKAAQALQDAGYAVEEVTPPPIAAAARNLLDQLDMLAAWQIGAPPVREYTRQWIASLFEVLGPRNPAVATLAFAIRQSLSRTWGEFQETHALILGPIGADIPFTVGTDRTPSGVADNLRCMSMSMAVNALGLPAVAVPVGVEQGLPQVVQLIGPRYREDLCLDAAEAVEHRFGVITPIEPNNCR